MPQVPADFVQTVMPTGQHAYEDVHGAATPDAFGAQFGQAVNSFGKTVEASGEMMAQNALRFQSIKNETDANKADIELTNRLTDLQYNVSPDKPLGFNNLKGSDAVDGYQDFHDKAQQAYQDVRATLPPGEAQQMFDRVGIRRIQMAIASGAEHTAQERLADVLDTSNQRIAVQRNLAACDPYNPSLLTQTLGLIQSEVQKTADTLGHHDPSVMAAAMQGQKDQLYHDVALKQLQDTTNPRGGSAAAMDFYNQHKNDMSLKMQNELLATLQPGFEQQAISKTVEGIMGGGSRPAANLTDAVGFTESKNKDYNPDGTPVTSPLGAKYRMQVMPDTAANPGYGIRPAQSDTPEEWNRVGEELLAKMLQRYGNNQTLAVAAYNAGPQTVDNLIAKYGDPRTGAIAEDAFINHLPVRRDANGKIVNDCPSYVRAINAAAPPTPGTPPTSTDATAHFQSWQQDVAAAAQQQRPNDAIYAQQMQNQLATKTALINHGQQMSEQAAHDTLTQAINSPQSPITSMDQLFADPARYQAYTQLWNSAPDKAINIQNMIKAKAKGDPVEPTAENQALWYQLHGQAFGPDAATFMNTDLNQFYGKLPDHQWQELVRIQGAINKHDVTEAAKGVNITAALTALTKSNELQAAGYKPNSKTKADAEKMSEFTGRLGEAIDQARVANNNKLPPQQDIIAIGQRLLTQGAIKGTGLISEDKMTLAEAQTANTEANFHVQVGQIPKNIKTGMTNAWTAAYGQPPDDSTLSAWATTAARIDTIKPDERAQIVSAYSSKNGGQKPTDQQVAMLYTRKQIFAALKAKQEADEAAKAATAAQPAASKSAPGSSGPALPVQLGY